MKTKFGTADISSGSVKLTYGCFTDVGKRRKVNEDNFLAVPDEAVFCVADGVGGLGAGDLASRLAIDGIAERLDYSVNQDHDATVEELIREANHEVYKQKQAIAMLMASTIVLARFQTGLVRIGHVGDSRAYLWRNKQLSRLTRDHSLVAELYRHGKIKREEMDHHPKRNIITRAVGVEREIEPDFEKVPLCHDDLLLLCTDGLTSMLNDDAIGTILTNSRQGLTKSGYELVKQANRAGGRDNITVILVHYNGSSQGGKVLSTTHGNSNIDLD